MGWVRFEYSSIFQAAQLDSRRKSKERSLINNNSVRLIDQELASSLEGAESGQLRAAALLVCRSVVEETGISEPIIETALKMLGEDKFDDLKLKRELQVLVKALDEIQWNLQEEEELGKVDLKTHRIAFNRARAANAVLCALDVDPFSAAAEAIYEACHATEREEELKKKIQNVLLAGNREGNCDN